MCGRDMRMNVYMYDDTSSYKFNLTYGYKRITTTT